MKKRLISLILLVTLCLSLTNANAELWPTVYGYAETKLDTRSGPATEYTTCGRYNLAGQYLRIVSYAYDCNGVLWLQVAVPYKNKYRCVYTGAKRFDRSTFSLYDLPQEGSTPDFVRAVMNSSCNPLYGPGYEFDTYADLRLAAGSTVSVVQYINGYAQVEFIGYSRSAGRQLYRCWVDQDYLSY